MQLPILLFILFFTLPIYSRACGGFIAVRGEKIFHSVYCSELKGMNLKNLRWFSTAKEAEISGLKMCEKCSEFYDDDFHPECSGHYFESDDPLILTAIEVSSEAEYQHGYEKVEDELDYYYKDGYNAGYADGYTSAKEQLDLEYQEKEESRKASSELDKIQSVCILAAFLICIIVFWDFMSASWSSFRKKDVNSGFGDFIEKSCSDNPLFPLIIGIVFAYGIVLMIFY